MYTLHRHICTALLLLLLVGCKSDPATTSTVAADIGAITLRLAEVPDRLNPMLSSSAVATSIENLIMVSPAEFHPTTLELIPVLIESLPQSLSITEGPQAGKPLYQMQFREDARWEDGSAVTAADYIFTLKLISNPAIANSWRSLLTDIIEVTVDPDYPRIVAVTLAEQKLQSLATVCNFNLYPAYAYDPDGMLADVPLSDLLRMEDEEMLQTYPQLEAFAQKFLSETYSRTVVTGAGPYELLRWDSDQAIVLQRKSDYWGASDAADNPILAAGPSQLTYRIIPDENTAITALRDGQIDLMADVSPLNFAKLKTENPDDFRFYTPQVMRYYYVGINGNDERLEELAVRQALARLLDVDELIDQLMGGLAARTVGPIHPSKGYYARDITPIPYDPATAASLLEEAGWTDTDGDGVLDKVKNGKKLKLSFSLKTTPRPLGKQIASILQENAAAVGIKIEIEPKEFRSILQDLRKGDFHLANLATSQYPGDYDAYSSWHTDNIGGAGRNYLGFGTSQSDSLISVIRSSASTDSRYAAYRDLQDMIAADQPAIFLFAPVERIISAAEYDLTVSPRRPGYFENTLHRADN